MIRGAMEGSAHSNDPGSWSSSRQRAVWLLFFVAVCALAWSLWLEGEFDRWASEGEREAVLRREHVALLQRVTGLEAVRLRRAQLEVELARPENQMPAAAEMEDLLRSITAAGRVRGLQFELFRPAPVLVRSAYAEIPVALRLVGGYHDIGGFLGDLTRMPRIVTLHNMTLTPQPSPAVGERSPVAGSRLLVLEATLRTYRALDAQELAGLAANRRSGERAGEPGGGRLVPGGTPAAVSGGTPAAVSGAVKPTASGGPR